MNKGVSGGANVLAQYRLGYMALSQRAFQTLNKKGEVE